MYDATMKKIVMFIVFSSTVVCVFKRFKLSVLFYSTYNLFQCVGKTVLPFVIHSRVCYMLLLEIVSICHFFIIFFFCSLEIYFVFGGRCFRVLYKFFPIYNKTEKAIIIEWIRFSFDWCYFLLFQSSCLWCLNW